MLVIKLVGEIMEGRKLTLMQNLEVMMVKDFNSKL